MHESKTLGLAVGPRQCVADQFQGEADVIRAVIERVQLCHDPPTQFAVIPRMFGRQQGEPHLSSARAHNPRRARTFDEVERGSLERLFPRFTEDSQEQATLSAGQSGVGCRKSVDVARFALLGAVVASRPQIREMIRDTNNAGLLGAEPLPQRWTAPQQPSWKLLMTVKRVIAKLCLHTAARGADEMWEQTVQGHHVPSAVATDDERDEEVTCVPARGGRVSAPQRQAKLSQLTSWNILGLTAGTWRNLQHRGSHQRLCMRSRALWERKVHGTVA